LQFNPLRPPFPDFLRTGDHHKENGIQTQGNGTVACPYRPTTVPVCSTFTLHRMTRGRHL
jgi:hypothetical protein